MSEFAFFVRTDTIFDRTPACRVEEAGAPRPRAAEMHRASEARPAPRPFAPAPGQRACVALVAGIEKVSPGKGVLIADIASVALARMCAENGAVAGVSAVLVGEALVKAPDVEAQVRAFGSVARRGTGGWSRSRFAASRRSATR